MSTPLLAVTGLNAWYGDAHILFDVNLTVARGEVVALMGRNGAGKSTLLKSVMGLIARTSGSVHFAGQNIAQLPPYRIARLGLGYVPEERRIFTELTVLQNLETGHQPPRAGLPPWTPERLGVLFPNLAGMPQRLGQHMSGGEQQMLTIARTLMGNPSLVLLDEPSEGVAPIVVDQMADMVRELKAQGLSVLLSEQNERFVERVCDRAYQLDQGHIRWEGAMNDYARAPWEGGRA
jgi:branched-chain amino acid transport system ATP-binding protein